MDVGRLEYYFRHIATMEDMGILYVVMIDSVHILGIHQYFYYYYSSTPSDITPVIRRSTVVFRPKYCGTPAGYCRNTFLF